MPSDDFQDQGYRWLVVRLTEGPKGGRKTIAVNGQVIGQFVRTGPPVEREEGMVGDPLLSDPGGPAQEDGPMEIRFTEPGIAISEVALSVEPVPNSDQ